MPLLGVGCLMNFSYLQAVDAWGTVDILVNNAGNWMFTSSFIVFLVSKCAIGMYLL